MICIDLQIFFAVDECIESQSTHVKKKTT
jgi:hypothetical protein